LSLHAYVDSVWRRGRTILMTRMKANSNLVHGVRLNPETLYMIRQTKLKIQRGAREAVGSGLVSRMDALIPSSCASLCSHSLFLHLDNRRYAPAL
jgi:hypothetical protein